MFNGEEYESGTNAEFSTHRTPHIQHDTPGTPHRHLTPTHRETHIYNSSDTHEVPETPSPAIMATDLDLTAPFMSQIIYTEQQMLDIEYHPLPISAT